MIVGVFYDSIFIIRPSLKPEEISMYKKYLNCDKNGNITNCFLLTVVFM